MYLTCSGTRGVQCQPTRTDSATVCKGKRCVEEADNVRFTAPCTELLAAKDISDELSCPLRMSSKRCYVAGRMCRHAQFFLPVVDSTHGGPSTQLKYAPASRLAYE